MPDSATALTVVDPLRLTRWGKTWRYLVAIGFGLVALISVASTPSASGPMPHGSDSQTAMWLVIDITGGAIAVVLMHFRRRYPRAVATTVALLTVVSLSATGVLCVVLISLATHRRWREVLPIGVLASVTGVSYEYLVPLQQDQSPWWLVTVVGALWFGILIVTGFYIGARRELVIGLQERALTAEHERAVSENQARLTERARIAREMHDVLAHRISLIAMHSGALVFRDDLTRDEVVDAATVVRDSAHLALAELRDVLGVLRDPNGTGLADSGARVVPPQPTLLLIDDLITEHVQAGGAVSLDMTPAVRQALSSVNATISRAAYRIVQEALTNAH